MASLVAVVAAGCTSDLRIYISQAGDDYRVLYCSDAPIDTVALKTGEKLSESDTVWTARGPAVTSPAQFSSSSLPPEWTFRQTESTPERWVMVLVTGESGARGYARFEAADIGEQWTDETGGHVSGDCGDAT